MYTMLMMMAVTSGGEASAFGHKKGCDGGSCQGAVVVASCQGSSCDGGRGGFLSRLCGKKDKDNGCHGSSCTGTVVAASCTGYNVAPAPYAGCTGSTVYGSCTGSSCQGSSCDGGRGGFLGGLMGHHRNKKNGCDGGSGCYGSTMNYAPAGGCTGGVVYAPAAGTVAPAPVAMPAKEMPKTEDKK